MGAGPLLDERPGCDDCEACPFITVPDCINRLQTSNLTLVEDIRSLAAPQGLPTCCTSGESHALLSIRLNYQGLRIGGLLLCSALPNPFSAEAVEIAREVADQLAIVIQQSELLAETRRALVREQKLNEISLGFNSTLDLESNLPPFLRLASSLLDADGAGISILREDGTMALIPGGNLPAPFDVRRVLPSGQGLSWQIVSSRQPLLLNDYPSQPLALPIWVAAGVKEVIAVPVVAGEAVMGALIIFRLSSEHPFNQRDLDLSEATGRQVGLALRNSQLFKKVQQSALDLSSAYDATIQGWSRALELRDKETQGHSERVTRLTLELAQKMGLPAARLPDFRRGVFLHDIGKMAIPDSILLKPGPLTEEEWAVMRLHPAYAFHLLSDIAYLRPVLDIPFCHHEHWDGSGYPRGLKGEAIPLPARIFAVVDVWDALTSDRPYRPAWSRVEARRHLLEQAGIQFDPAVVGPFLEIIDAEAPASEP